MSVISLYDEASVKIKSNSGIPSQIKEHFTSVFSKGCVCAGGGNWSECIGNETIELEITHSGELGAHWFEDKGFNNIIHHF